MDIKTFLSLCQGMWFAQKTHYVGSNQPDNGKADLNIETIAADHPQTTQLCQQYQLDSAQSVGGIKTSWDTSVDWGKSQQRGSTVVILIADRQNPNQGDVIRHQLPNQVNRGRYTLGEDNALTLLIEDQSTILEERQWFASENLRLRTAVVKHKDAVVQTCFYSEIRRKPADS